MNAQTSATSPTRIGSTGAPPIVGADEGGVGEERRPLGDDVADDALSSSPRPPLRTSTSVTNSPQQDRDQREQRRSRRGARRRTRAPDGGRAAGPRTAPRDRRGARPSRPSRSVTVRSPSRSSPRAGGYTVQRVAWALPMTFLLLVIAATLAGLAVAAVARRWSRAGVGPPSATEAAREAGATLRARRGPLAARLDPAVATGLVAHRRGRRDRRGRPRASACSPTWCGATASSCSSTAALADWGARAGDAGLDDGASRRSRASASRGW